MIHQLEKIQHINSIAHEGKVVVFATSVDGQVHYSVKQDGFEDSYLSADAEERIGWEAWQELAFPDEDEDASVAQLESKEFTYEREYGRYVTRSLYRTHEATVVAPVQLVSANGHIYVFRQSKEGRLLVDRYVLDGLTNTLSRKMEVRFKRSRQKHKPTESMKKGSKGLAAIDSLDFRDAQNEPFYEATTELTVIDNMANGWFSVVQVPTFENDVYRWHIFAYNSESNSLELTTIRASEEGLFDVKDYKILQEVEGQVKSRTIKGIIRRVFTISGATVNGNPAATKYDLQKSREDQEGNTQLIKTATRLMVVVPTTSGTAALSFAIAADGTLALTKEESTTEDIRSRKREILLPLNTLENIKAVTDLSVTPKGEISGHSRAEDEDIEDQILVYTETTAGLEDSDLVKIKNSRTIQGHYQVNHEGDDVFSIELSGGFGLGDWEQQEEEQGGLYYEGMITEYHVDGGRLYVICPNHGLNQDDEVQISGTKSSNGTYAITNVNDHSFAIDRKWPAAEAVNLRLAANKRRGLVFDGIQDFISIADHESLHFGLYDDFTIELWVKSKVDQSGPCLITSRSFDGSVNKGFSLSPAGDNYAFSLGDGESGVDLSFAKVKDGRWHHLAISVDRDGEIMAYQDGRLAAQTPAMNLSDIDSKLGVRIGKEGAGRHAQHFSGQMAGVRLWHVARSGEDIKNSMHLQMSGRETGLAGSWRMGGIAEGKVIDFSANSNHGYVTGDPYVSAVERPRKIANPKAGQDSSAKPFIDVDRYSNYELFAVSERATYRETFEFKINSEGPLDIETIRNADGKGNPIFRPSYWGKPNRTAEEVTEIDGPSTFEFSDAFNGWFQAEAEVEIRDDVSLLRLFEIADVKGTWESIEIRKHRVLLVSDRTGRQTFSEELNLLPLADEMASLPPIMAKFKTYEQIDFDAEREHLKFRIERAQLEDPNLPWIIRDLRASTTKLRSEIQTAEANLLFWYAEERRAAQEVVFFWDHGQQGNHVKTGLGAVPVINDKWHNWMWEVTSVTIPPGLKVYMWDDSYYKGRGVTVSRSSNNLGHSHNFQDAMSSFIVVTAYGNNWSKIKNGIKACKVIISQTPFLNTEETRLRNLEESLRNKEARLAIIDRRLNELRNILDGNNRSLSDQQSAYMNSFRQLDQTPQPMAAVGTALGLTVEGALLDFIKPAGRVSVLETCEGNVQVSFFDSQGQMRQVNYDALAGDDNATFGQWLVDKGQVCLNMSRYECNVTFEPADDLPAEWSIETWFAYPLAVSMRHADDWERFNTLVQAENLDAHVTVKTSWYEQKLGIYLNEDPRETHFYDCGFDLATLETGWHHLTAVGRGDTTEFYIDGQLVGDTKGFALAAADKELKEAAAKTLKATEENKLEEAADYAKLEKSLEKRLETLQERTTVLRVKGAVRILGNQADRYNNCQFGRIAEFRIWETALTAQEIVANSKLRLSGREPGLLAYYPLNEGQGNIIKNKTGRGHEGTVSAADWWPSGMPLGNLEHDVLTFDGINDYVALPADDKLRFGSSTSFTIEMWVKVNGKTRSNTGLISNWIEQSPNRGFQLLNTEDGCLFIMKDDSGQSEIAELGAINDGLWHHLAVAVDRSSGHAFGYRDGRYVELKKIAHVGSVDTALNIKIGHDGLATNIDLAFKGNIADVRIWHAVRQNDEIVANMNKRLTGHEDSLVAYYPLNVVDLDGETKKVQDFSANKLDGVVHEALAVPDSGLPLGGGALVSNEYSTMIVDPLTNKKSAIMRRFFAFPRRNGVELLPDKRVEALQLQWIGNAQFEPTLLGYIEGAPPVPSENLTLEDDYNGATAVELTQTDDITYSWNRSQEYGLGGSAEAFLGADVEAEAGLGLSTKISALRGGLKGNLEFGQQFANESSIASSSSLSMTDKLELRGTPEDEPKFPELGNRFIPKNVGYALVVSALADVFITRLERSGRMVGYKVMPVENIPPDVNTITFLMNPAYTMNGSLDGMTGSKATSQRFFKHVPEMRAQFGSLYPASYYRLQEAYALKQQIEREDKRRESYFASFNTRNLGEGALSDEIDTGPRVITTGVPREVEKSDPKLSEEDKEKARKAKTEMTRKKATAEVADKGAAAEKKHEQIQSAIDDQDARVHATTSFDGWQRRMEDIQIRAGKRNIVNTYVWDADGGLRSETQSFANTVEHTIGGSFYLSAGLGYEGAVAGGGGAAELTAQATINITQTMSKTEERSRGFELSVDLDGLEHRGITNYNDLPIMPGEKVDRYRFMTFYLEGTTKNFNDFFNYVVDPEWLSSNDEEARALRQTQAGKPNKSWRVLHRVTYVERPALMGFGRDTRMVEKTKEKTETEKLSKRIEDMEATLNWIKATLRDR